MIPHHGWGRGRGAAWGADVAVRLTGSTLKLKPPSREKALWMVVLPCASASVLPRPSVAILPGMASKYSR